MVSYERLKEKLRRDKVFQECYSILEWSFWRDSKIKESLLNPHYQRIYISEKWMLQVLKKYWKSLSINKNDF